MGKIKYILCFVLSIVFSGLFMTSCGNEDKSVADADNRLVGTWISQGGNTDFREEIAFLPTGEVTSTLYAQNKAMNPQFVDSDGVCHKVKGVYVVEDDQVKLSKVQVYDYEEYHNWAWHGLEVLENVADMSYLMQARYTITESGDTLVLHSFTSDGEEDNIYIRKK